MPSPHEPSSLVGEPPDPPPALIGIFGTPSSMTHWGIHVVRALVDAVAGEHGVLHGNYLSEFAEARSAGRRGPTLLCTSDCPEVRLCRFIGDTGAPVVVFAEDPADIIDDVVAVSGVDHVNALRLAARSLCALQPLLEAPGATVIGKGHLDWEMAGFVDWLLPILRLPATPEQRATVDRHLGLSGRHDPGEGCAEGIRRDTVRDHLARLFPFFLARRRELEPPAAEAPAAAAPEAADPAAPAAGDAAASGTAPPMPAHMQAHLPAHMSAHLPSASGVKAVALCYEGLTAGAPLEAAEWPASIFSSGDNIGQFVAGPCDLLGPARIVIYGPYMHLPLGDWTSRVEIEVAENESGNRLKVDLVCGPRVLVSASADMPPRGQYGFSLPFTISEPLEPVELRFQIESGAIEGRFLLRRVLMSRQTLPQLAAAG